MLTCRVNPGATLEHRATHAFKAAGYVYMRGCWYGQVRHVDLPPHRKDELAACCAYCLPSRVSREELWFFAIVLGLFHTHKQT